MRSSLIDSLTSSAKMITPDKFLQLLQEQQLDNVETSMKTLGCRDPMSLLTLHQAYLQRMMDRWAKLSATTPGTKAAARSGGERAATAPAAKAAPVVKSAPVAAPKPAPQPKSVPTNGTATPPKVEPMRAANEAAAPKPKADDLTAIKGIGPKFAKTLNEHGIQSYQQLASLSPADVAALEEKLGFAGRFARENWIEQARALVAH